MDKVPKENKESLMNAITIISLVIAIASGAATIANFIFDHNRLIEEQNRLINVRATEAWDLIGGDEGTIWIEMKLICSASEHKRLIKALNIIENDILAKNANHKRGMELKAIIMSKIGNYDVALEHFNRLLKIYPDYHIGYTNRGCFYLGFNKYDKARDDFTTALKIDESYARAHYSLGVLEFRLRDYNQAYNAYTKAIEKDNRLSLAYFQRGKVCSLINKPDEALTDYNSAIEINNSFTDAYIKRAELFLDKKLYQEAIHELNIALEIDPESSGALNAKSWILATCANDNLRNGQLAIALAQKSIGFKEEYFELATLAAAYAEIEDFRSAIDAQKRAITLYKDIAAHTYSPPDPVLLELESHFESYKAMKPWRE